MQRVALVTGGGGGVGAEVCRRLAADGVAVAAADVDLDRARGVAGEVGALAVHLDVTDPRSVESAVATVTAELGAPTVLVGCAGWDRFRRFLDTDEAFAARVLEINLAGPIRVTRAVLGAMVATGWGRVVHVASDAGRVGSSMEAVYAGAKGGLIAFTKTIAREHARDGVTANSVCPGPVDTPMLAAMGEEDDLGAKVVSALGKAIPLGRLAQPSDIAPAIAFLCGDDAGYLTGQTLSVSGGLTMA